MKKKEKSYKELTEEQIEDFLIKVGKRMKSYRLEKGFKSYEIFAYEHNLPRAQYGKYETGAKDLRLSSFAKVINAFGVSPKEFFSEGFD